MIHSLLGAAWETVNDGIYTPRPTIVSAGLGGGIYLSAAQGGYLIVVVVCAPLNG